MARFSLVADANQKALGEKVLRLAEAAGQNGGTINDKELKAKLESELIELIDPSFRNGVEIVYDTPHKAHIVIPYLEKATYSDNNLANEAMGGIVIMGCGR